MKKATKRLSALLAVLLIFGMLAGCGSQPAAEKAAPAAEEAPAETTDTAEAEAPEAEAPEAEAAEEDVVYDPLDITIMSSYGDTDFEGVMWNYFIDYVTEKSNGAITFTKYMSGTLGDAGEEMSMVSEGSVQLMMISPAKYASTIPTLCILQNIEGSAADCLAYYDYILNENEVSSAILAEDLAAQGLRYMGCCLANASGLYISKNADCTTIDDFKNNCTLGVISAASYEEQGFKSFVIINGADMYESIRTGVCDGTSCTGTSFVTSRLFEVSKAALGQGMHQAGSWMACSIDWWNGLPEATQELLTEAGFATEQYSLEYTEDVEANVEQVCKDNGIVYNEMTKEESSENVFIMWEQSCDGLITKLGASTGKSEVIRQALQVCNEYLGYDDEIDLDSYVVE